MSLDGESCDGDWRRSQVPIYFAFIIRGSRNLCYHHKNAFTKWDVNGIGVQKFQLDLRSWAGIGNRWLSEMALELMAKERYSELGHVARKESEKRLKFSLGYGFDWIVTTTHLKFSQAKNLKIHVTAHFALYTEGLLRLFRLNGDRSSGGSNSLIDDDGAIGFGKRCSGFGRPR